MNTSGIIAIGVLLVLTGWHFSAEWLIVIGLIMACGGLVYAQNTEDTGE